MVTVDIETRETPARFHLPPGVPTVTFYSDQNGLTRYEPVVIEPDKVVKLDEDMQR